MTGVDTSGAIFCTELGVKQARIQKRKMYWLLEILFEDGKAETVSIQRPKITFTDKQMVEETGKALHRAAKAHTQ